MENVPALSHVPLGCRDFAVAELALTYFDCEVRWVELRLLAELGTSEEGKAVSEDRGSQYEEDALG